MGCFIVSVLLPPVFGFTVVAIGYYAFVAQVCVYYITWLPEKILYLVLSHIVLVLAIWSYMYTVLMPHKAIPAEYHLSKELHEQILKASEEEANKILEDIIQSRELDVTAANQNWKLRYCKICLLVKPNRTHHCRACKRCIMKMDHHCPWIANCVSPTNQKQFLLMLVYGAIIAIFYLVTVGPYLFQICRTLPRFAPWLILFGYLMAAVIGLNMLGVFCFQCQLVIRDKTTLETRFHLKGRETQQDNAVLSNLKSVLGDEIYLWWLPITFDKTPSKVPEMV